MYIMTYLKSEFSDKPAHLCESVAPGKIVFVFLTKNIGPSCSKCR